MIMVEVITESPWLYTFLFVSLASLFGMFIYFSNINPTYEPNIVLGQVIAPIAGAIFLVIALSGLFYTFGKVTTKLSERENENAERTFMEEITQEEEIEDKEDGKEEQKEKDESKNSDKKVAALESLKVGGVVTYEGGW